MDEMVNAARKSGKVIPQHSWLASEWPIEMQCPVCDVDMSCDSSNKTNKITLQHWQDGTLGFICYSCNISHGNMSRKYSDADRRIMVAGHAKKMGYLYCTCCDQIRVKKSFSRNRSRKTGYEAWCKPCSSKNRRIKRLQQKGIEL
jgi:hypothetical protein